MAKMIYKPEPEHINGQWNPVHSDLLINYANKFNRLQQQVILKIEVPRAMELPIEDRVIWFLKRYEWAQKMSEIEHYFTVGNYRKEGEITARTAVKHLIKEGRVEAHYHEQGCYRYYTYHVTGK